MTKHTSEPCRAKWPHEMGSGSRNTLCSSGFSRPSICGRELRVIAARACLEEAQRLVQPRRE